MEDWQYAKYVILLIEIIIIIIIIMKFGFRALSYEPVDRFRPNLHRYNVGRV